MTRYDWMEQAVCAEIGGDNWFHGDGDYNAALNYCQTCPVRQQCADFAQRLEGDVSVRDRHGTFGGQRPRQRAPRTSVHNAVDRTKIAHLDSLGWTAAKIAEQLGCTPRTVVRARTAARQEAA